MTVELLTLGNRVRGVFRQASEEVAEEAFVERLTFRTTSDQEEETWAWLGRAPRMDPWDHGPRTITRPSEFSLKIPNVDFANAVEVPQKTWRRRRFGEIDRVIRDLSTQGRTHPNELLSDKIRDAETSVCYDGQFFFDTDHEEGKSGVQSNNITFNAAVPASPTPTEFRDAVNAAIKKMRTFKDDSGRPIHRGPATYMVMIPTELLDTANVALRSVVLADGSGAASTNVLMSSPDIVDNADLNDTWGGSAKKFAIFRTDGTGAPFILQEEVPLFMDNTDALNERELFLRKRLLFGAQRTYNIQYGHWQKAVLTTFN